MRALAFPVIIGVPASLSVAAVYELLSPREWAISMFAWVATLLVWAGVGKRIMEKHESIAEPESEVSEGTRKRILRDIRKRKVWIGILIVSLPIGIANGLSHRAWLPTSAGVAISLFLVYVSIREIKHRRKRLNLTR